MLVHQLIYQKWNNFFQEEKKIKHFLQQAVISYLAYFFFY